VHASGRAAQERVEAAREAVARLLGTRAGRITFTSGATEANNAAIHAWARKDARRPLLVSTSLEHPSVAEPLRRLEPTQGWHRLPATAAGGTALDGLADLPAGRIGLVACLAANNETGVLQPWREIRDWAREAEVPLHVDLTQVAGREPVALDGSGIASASLSGHKLGALAGCGVLWMAGDLEPLLLGGPQERGRRAGTENVAGIVALGAVADRLVRHGEEERTRIGELGRRLRKAVAALPGVEFGVPQGAVLDNTVHLRLPVEAEAVLIRLDLQGVCASMGSACSAGAVRPSRTLLAMGWSEEQARRALRLSLGWSSTAGEVDRAAGILGQILSNLGVSEKSSA